MSTHHLAGESTSYANKYASHTVRDDPADSLADIQRCFEDPG